MANIEHKDIVDAQRHEPKGASTASIGQVYVSDGAGSGLWQPPPIDGLSAASLGMVPTATGAGAIVWKYHPEGFGFYGDSGVAPQVFNNTASKLVINGLATTSTSAYLPYQIRGISELWDTVTNRLNPIAEGDTYQIRIDLPITAKTGTPTELTVTVDIGATETPSFIILEKFEPAAKAAPYTISVEFNVRTLDTFKLNGGQFFLTTDSGTITVTGAGIQITRTSAGDF